MKSRTLHALALVAASIVACRTGGGAPAGKASVAMDPGVKVAEGVKVEISPLFALDALDVEMHAREIPPITRDTHLREPKH